MVGYEPDPNLASSLVMALNISDDLASSIIKTIQDYNLFAEFRSMKFETEQKKKRHTCAYICDGLPTLCANHPWWVDQYQNFNRDHILYTTRDPPSQHRYRIPLFLGRRIQGCFHGWVVLSNHPFNDVWSLWNPVTCKIICLPRLISSEKGDRECCLSSPPDYHGSIFMLTTAKKQTIVFCRLDRRRRKRYKWVEMSYAKKMKSMMGRDDHLLSNLTCCNGKVYALISFGDMILSVVILVDIAVKGTEIVISLLRYLDTPPSIYMYVCPYTTVFLKGCCTELLFVQLCLTDDEAEVCGVSVFKLDTKDKKWDKIEDLKDDAIFLNLSQGGSSMFYSAAIGSELGGGYVHLLDGCGEVIHSYDLKNKTVALSSMPTNYPSSSLEDRWYQQEDLRNTTTMIEDGNMESRLLNIPFDILKIIMEFCVGIEYLNFRLVCKICHLAAPMIRWSKGGRLQTYSLVSPWLMVLDKDRGVTSFTDPMFDDTYFVKTPPELIGNLQIYCSRYGWLLIRNFEGLLMFFNPFTSDIRELPGAPFAETYYFSAPPTSSGCIVVGFKISGERRIFYVHSVAQEPSWRRFYLFCDSSSSRSFHLATHYAQNCYALYNNGSIDVVDTYKSFSWRKIIAKGPAGSCGPHKQNFIMKCDHHGQVLQVIMGKFGGGVEVLKLNKYSSTVGWEVIESFGWEVIESLGRHAIYISGKSSSCLCVEAKMARMANKIYFPRVHSEKSRKIVFYCLETRSWYNTSNIEDSMWSLMGTTYHANPHVWIQPSWS